MNIKTYDLIVPSYFQMAYVKLRIRYFSVSGRDWYNREISLNAAPIVQRTCVDHAAKSKREFELLHFVLNRRLTYEFFGFSMFAEQMKLAAFSASRPVM